MGQQVNAVIMEKKTSSGKFLITLFKKSKPEKEILFKYDHAKTMHTALNA